MLYQRYFLLSHQTCEIPCITKSVPNQRTGQYIGPKFPLLNGVPQGGCLSPTLFALYTADVPPPSGMNEMIIYADDITEIVQKKKTARTI